MFSLEKHIDVANGFSPANHAAQKTLTAPQTIDLAANHQQPAEACDDRRPA